jgi:dihydroxyacetone kinase-like predicted kinase
VRNLIAAGGATPARLRDAVAAAHDALIEHEAALNRLNVFPVADGDTGTNMVATVASVRAALDSGAVTMPSVREALRRRSLFGARGNSGVLLSQFLGGVAEALPPSGPATGVDLADGLRRGRDAARAALAEPVEGTILTVADAAAGAAHDGVAADGWPPDAASVLQAAAGAGRRALLRTPELLPALAEAGVVDAGGAGLSLVLDAFAAVLSGEPRPAPDWPAVRPRRAAPHRGDDGAGPGGPAGVGEFEVLCLLDADPGAIGRLRRRWAALGTSVATVGSGGLWKCHVHTGDPQAAVELARRAGRALRTEITPLPGGHHG